MAMTKESMADYIEQRLDAIAEVQYEGSNPAGLDAKRRAYLEAFCQGIIDEITTNGRAVGNDSPSADTHNLDIE